MRQYHRTKHFIKTWWIIAADEPDLDYDEIAPQNLTLNSQAFKVLHDPITRVHGIALITIPATSPSFTEYFGAIPDLDDEAGHAVPPPDPFRAGVGPKWIGTLRVISGSVKNDGHPNRWRLQTVNVIMK